MPKNACARGSRRSTRGCELLELDNRHPAGIERRDQGAGARPGQSIDSNFGALEALQDADMSDGVGGPTAQRETDPRAALRHPARFAGVRPRRGPWFTQTFSPPVMVAGQKKTGLNSPIPLYRPRVAITRRRGRRAPRGKR